MAVTPGALAGTGGGGGGSGDGAILDGVTSTIKATVMDTPTASPTGTDNPVLVSLNGTTLPALPAGSAVIGSVTQSGTWTVQPGNTVNTTPWLTSDSYLQKNTESMNGLTVRTSQFDLIKKTVLPAPSTVSGNPHMAFDGVNTCYFYSPASVNSQIYKYNILTDTVTALTNGTTLAEAYAGATILYANGKLYFTRGGGFTTFYSLTTDGVTFTTLTATTNGTNFGCALVWDGSDYIYLRNTTPALERYSISGNSWSSMTAPGSAGAEGMSMVMAGTDRMYSLQGGGTTGFSMYKISGTGANAWTAKTVTPGNVYDGGSLAWNGDNYIYAFQGNGGTPMYRYDILANTWDTLLTMPILSSTGSGMITMKNGMILCYLTDPSGITTYGVVNNLYVFDPTNNAIVRGRYNSTQPTLATGQQGEMQLSADGSLVNALDSTTETGADGVSNTIRINKDAFGFTPVSKAHLWGYNGTTWDRIRTDTTNGLWVNVKSVVSNQSVNVAQINGITPLMGNGTTGTGSQRVTIASDNTAFSVNATLSAETTKVIGTARIIGNGGATLDSVVGAGTAPTNQIVVGALYNSTEISPTTGQAFALQADAKGRLRGVIMDAAGNTRGANVDANNNLGVVLAAETTKVLGVTRTADGAGNLLTSNSTTYTAKFGLDANLLGTLGTAFSTAGKVDVKGADGDVFVRQTTAANLNATVVGTGTFVVQATLAAETTKVIGTARVIGNAGATLDSTVGAGTAPTNQVVVGALYNSTEISPTTGQAFALQADSKGRLRGVIMDAAGNTRGANVDSSNRLSVTVDNIAGSLTLGTVTTVSTLTNQSQEGGVAISLNAGAVDTGTRRVVQANGAGKTIVSVGGSAASSGNNTLVAAGTNKLKVFAFSLSTTSTTSLLCIFQSGASGTELWRVRLQAGTSVSTGANLSVSPPAWLFATASATLLNLNLSSANAVDWSVSYYDEA